MTEHPVPFDEERRQRLIDESGILDDSSWRELDQLTAYATQYWNVPIATVSIVERQRQFFKSCIGLSVRETGRDVAFCAHTIMSDASLVVPDATRDRRFADNALVTGAPGIRFYAGAPILVDGVAFGTVCLIDLEPREHFGPEDQERLSALAEAAARHIEKRRLQRFADLGIEEQIAAADARRRSSERDRSVFVAMISHELRTPLGVISGFSDLLRTQDERLTPAEREGYLHMIADSARQLQEITDDAIRFAAADFGRLPNRKESFVLLDVMNEAFHSAQLEPFTDQSVAALLSGDFAEMLSDRAHMRQVLSNMFCFLKDRRGEAVSIAAQHSPCGGLVLHARQSANAPPASWSVAPIAPYRDDENFLNRGQDGLALGLAYAERLARALGMRLYHLRSEDGLSTLRLSIPAYLFGQGAPAGEQPDDAPRAAARPLGGRTHAGNQQSPMRDASIR